MVHFQDMPRLDVIFLNNMTAKNVLERSRRFKDNNSKIIEFHNFTLFWGGRGGTSLSIPPSQTRERFSFSSSA